MISQPAKGLVNLRLWYGFKSRTQAKFIPALRLTNASARTAFGSQSAMLSLFTR